MLKHSVKLFEMGSSHIQPAWESKNNNKKSGRGGGRHGCSRFSPPEPTVRGASGGEPAGGAGPGGGGGRSSLRGWDVPAASFAAGRRAGLGRGGGPREGAGGALAAAPPLPVWPSAWLLPLGPRPPQDWPSPFKENSEWRECEEPGAVCGPRRPQTAGVAQSVSLTPGGRRASQRLRGR